MVSIKNRSRRIWEFEWITNNPVKRVGLKSFGLEMIQEVPIPIHHDPDESEEKLDKPQTKEGFLKKLMLE
jgi:3,4-dihydroxy 2-butanone 4-phosphate synthase/GTP cyclohydrolase II